MSEQMQDWQALLAQPLKFVQSRHLRVCLPDNLTDQQYVGLSSAPRFKERLLQSFIEHFQLQPLALTPLPAEADLAVLMLSPAEFARLPRLCGAIWHSAALSHEIRGDVVSQLRSLLGAEVFSAALSHRSLAGAANLLRQPAELVEVIDRDGAQCVSAWLARQPGELRDWLHLRLDMPSVQPSQSAPNPEIVRRAAMALTRTAEEFA